MMVIINNELLTIKLLSELCDNQLIALSISNYSDFSFLDVNISWFHYFSIREHFGFKFEDVISGFVRKIVKHLFSI